jgi:hypothetical protein
VNKKFLTEPRSIEKVFPMLSGTLFKRGIDCAFNGKQNQVFIFSGNKCAIIQYVPGSDHSTKGDVIKGPFPINQKFTQLQGTRFEYDIDAAIRYTEKYVYLFKKEKCIQLNYLTGEHYGERRIHECFPFLVGTVFETGIDAAFASNDTGNAYIFKGKHYVRINVAERDGKAMGNFIVSSRIRFIGDIWN